MVCVEAAADADVGIANGIAKTSFEVTMLVPFILSTHYGVACDLVRVCQQLQAQRLVFHRLKFQDLSLITVRVEGIMSTRAVDLKSKKNKQPVDKLEQSMEDYLKPSRKRLHSKNTETSGWRDGSSSDDKEESSSSSYDSEQYILKTNGQQDPVPDAATGNRPIPKATLLFSEEQLGVFDMRLVPSGRAICVICSNNIPKDTVRASWAFNRRKPHRFIHASCISAVDGERGRRALALLQQIIVDINDDVSHVLRAQADLLRGVADELEHKLR